MQQKYVTALRSTVRRAVRLAVRRFVKAPVDLPLLTWRLERDGSGGLTLDQHSLERLLERFGSPLHVADGTRLRDNAARFMVRPNGCARACEVYYSYKTNPVPGVLSALHALGVGAEVTSPYELWLARKLGVAPSNIVINGPAMPASAVRQAIAMDVGLMNLNSGTQIGPTAALAQSMGKRLRVGIRVAVPGSVAGQFGESVDDGSALRAYAEAIKHSSLEVIGVHAHRNREIATRRELEDYLAPLLRFVDELNRQLGVSLQILDLGGNLGCPTVSAHSTMQLARRLELALRHERAVRAPETVLTIDEYVTTVIGSVERHFGDQGRPAPRVFLEPGRALTSNSQMLLCRVLQVREPDDSGLSCAVLDAGINVAESLRSERHQLFRLTETQSLSRRQYRLYGPSCTLADLLYRACNLDELTVGDGLAIMDSGAYFVPYSTCFSFPRPAVVMIDGPDVRVLRRFETFDDLVALDTPFERIAERAPEADVANWPS